MCVCEARKRIESLASGHEGIALSSAVRTSKLGVSPFTFRHLRSRVSRCSKVACDEDAAAKEARARG